LASLQFVLQSKPDRTSAGNPVARLLVWKINMGGRTISFMMGADTDTVGNGSHDIRQLVSLAHDCSANPYFVDGFSIKPGYPIQRYKPKRDRYLKFQNCLIRSVLLSKSFTEVTSISLAYSVVMSQACLTHLGQRIPIIANLFSGSFLYLL
jgi:hypothetical protein